MEGKPRKSAKPKALRARTTSTKQVPQKDEQSDEGEGGVQNGLEEENDDSSQHTVMHLLDFSSASPTSSSSSSSSSTGSSSESVASCKPENPNEESAPVESAAPHPEAEGKQAEQSRNSANPEIHLSESWMIWLNFVCLLPVKQHGPKQGIILDFS